MASVTDAQYTIEQAEEDIADLRGQTGQMGELIQTLGLLIGNSYWVPVSGDTTGVTDYGKISAAWAAGQVPHLLPGSTYYLSQPLAPGAQARIVGDGPSSILTYGTSWSGTGLFKPTGASVRIEKMSVNTLAQSFVDWNNVNTADFKLDDVLVTCGTPGMAAGSGAPIFANSNAHQLSMTDCSFTQNDANNAVFTIINGGSGNGSGFSGAKITRCKTFLACVPTTTVAAGSNGGEISQIATWGAGFGGNGILDVASTAGWPASGTFWVAASGSTVGRVTYTGTTATSFTGCAYVSGSATGTIATGGVVSNSSNNIAQAGVRSISGWDISCSGNKNVDVIIFRDCFFSNIATANNGVNSFTASTGAGGYPVFCGITTASANNDFDRLEMWGCDFDAPIAGMVQASSVDCVWLNGMSCGNIVKGALTATQDLISITTTGGVGGGGQPCTQVSLRDYCRESGGIPHGTSGSPTPSDFGCTSDTLNVTLDNLGVPDNGVSIQINISTDGSATPAGPVHIFNIPFATNILLQNTTTANKKTVIISNGAITVGGTAITVP